MTAPANQPLPKAVDEAYENGETVALLVYRPGGIDDRKVSEAASVLDEMPGVAYFSVAGRQGRQVLGDHRAARPQRGAGADRRRSRAT